MGSLTVRETGPKSPLYRGFLGVALLLAHHMATSTNRTKATTPPTAPPAIAPGFECSSPFPEDEGAGAIEVDAAADAVAAAATDDTGLVVPLGFGTDKVAVAVAEADAELVWPDDELELVSAMAHSWLLLHS